MKPHSGNAVLFGNRRNLCERGELAERMTGGRTDMSTTTPPA
ncbi:hypothetical protein CK203_068177 [Vitis vinifera]|uniref:Uncharacterized protein n=1 Tax=Vitis vinifera TaxID=29760 RepID=A0A438E1C5_VITVI|nr:hypothetical protein CK203_068177 [Vitis vinifera]